MVLLFYFTQEVHMVLLFYFTQEVHMVLLILLYTGGAHGTPDFTLYRKKHMVLLTLLYTGGAPGTPDFTLSRKRHKLLMQRNTKCAPHLTFRDKLLLIWLKTPHLTHTPHPA